MIETIYNSELDINENNEFYIDFLNNNELEHSEDILNNYIETEQELELDLIKDYFNSLLDFKYNNYYLIGSLKFWNGTTTGGKECKELNDLFTGNYDLEIQINEKKQIIFIYKHHDGAHYLYLKELTKVGKVRQDKIDIDEMIKENRKQDFKFIKYNNEI